MKYHEAGKGSKPRKTANYAAYEEGWDRIFGSKKVAKKKHTCPYREKMFGDHATLCDCDHDGTHSCQQDALDCGNGRRTDY